MPWTTSGETHAVLKFRGKSQRRGDLKISHNFKDMLSGIAISYTVYCGQKFGKFVEANFGE